MKTFLTRNLFVSTILSAAFASMFFSSCQDEDFGYTAEGIRYQKNFEAAYGTIDSNQNWDLSSSAGWTDPSFSVETRSSSGQLQKSDDQSGHFSVKDGYWEVPKKLLNWLETYLVEGHDNRYLGSNFILQMPKNDFIIIPIFQGASAIMSQLELKVNDYDITTIWTKSDNMQVIDANYPNWTDLGYFDGRSKYDVYEQSGSKRAAETLNVSQLRSKPIYFRHNKIGDDQKYMYLSLKNIAKIRWGAGENEIWDKDNEWTTVGHRLTSINSKGHMLALNIPWDERPSLDALPKISEEGLDPKEMLIVGCEDAEGAGTDHDVNDVVFMIIGYPDAPKVIPTTEVIKKRYMCEDLGATDDFDFNDIVVDVTQTMDYTLETSGDADSYTDPVEITGMSANESTKKQTAKISHVCGTLPFQVIVGDYVFPKVSDPQNKYQTRRELWNDHGTRATEVEGNGWNPNETKTITGWNPSTNNIQIFVSGWNGVAGEKVNNVYDGNSTTDAFADFSSGTYKVVNFSRPGTVPYIIATDQDVPWMSERADIPEQWLVGDMTARTNKNGETTAGAGSSLYYTPSSDTNPYEDEAIIWTGSVTGSKDVGGVKIAEGTPEFQAFQDAKVAYYNVINIYGTSVSGGKYGLKLADGTKRKLDVPDGSREINTGEDADYFYQPSGSNVTRIVLTDRELQMLGIRGLFVTFGLDGMEITKISMSRGVRNNNQSSAAAFYDVYLSAPTGGSIISSDRERQAMKMSTDETTGKAVYEDENSDRLRVPFNHSRFLNDPVQGSQSFTLTAVADEGYRFVRWSDGDTNITRTIDANSAHGTSSAPLSAIFEKLYLVKFTPQHYHGEGMDYTYDLGGKCSVTLTQGDNTYTDEVWAAVGETFDVTPVPAEGYEFLYWWKNNDGSNNTTPRQITVSAPSSGDVYYIYGVFKEKEYTITLHPDNGCIAYISEIDGVAVEGKTTTSGSYKHGTKLTLKAELKDDYEFIQWSNGDKNLERTLTVTSNGDPSAQTERKKHVLTMTDLTDADKDVHFYVDKNDGQTKFTLAEAYCPYWTKVNSSSVGYEFSSALSQGKSLRFILDFNGEDLYAPWAAYLGSMAYSENGVSTTDHKFVLMSEDNAGENCTYENKILSFVLTKAQFDEHFMRVINGTPTKLSDMYFGFWNFLPASIKVQVVD